MKPICSNCHYYCLEQYIDCDHDSWLWDYSKSFCGLHGRAEILDPNKPLRVTNMENRKDGIHCGFRPLEKLIPIQLSLFN